MKFVTKEIEKRMNRYPLYSQDGKGEDAEVIVKYFNPYGGQSWYVLEAGTPDEKGNRELFVYCTNNGEAEYGYIMLTDITETKVNVFGYRMPLERDMYFHGNMKDAKNDAGIW